MVKTSHKETLFIPLSPQSRITPAFYKRADGEVNNQHQEWWETQLSWQARKEIWWMKALARDDTTQKKNQKKTYPKVWANNISGSSIRKNIPMGVILWIAETRWEWIQSPKWSRWCDQTHIPWRCERELQGSGCNAERRPKLNALILQYLSMESLEVK